MKKLFLIIISSIYFTFIIIPLFFLVKQVSISTPFIRTNISGVNITPIDWVLLLSLPLGLLIWRICSNPQEILSDMLLGVFMFLKYISFLIAIWVGATFSTLFFSNTEYTNRSLPWLLFFLGYLFYLAYSLFERKNIDHESARRSLLKIN
ncbi:MAG: hypothetical protein A2937_02245 [Candidatus Yonathbacteria bacterium RIFCSPLOWO2_01_FULL_47_33b]|uniref:Uncharacterized protein n=1 Tax=Candidatus Yonathbacteria bacterium RIFCSPLOWO2_01_FULL_47_33b TaxID=1802727 RepID=A0A1G2SD71_9BACT|nr:MAG: hypothetical protein A2937_02245 [Candidatus Yonathbacteria bacterium RIFCSPLOWO2_01_FULL_47_33b]